MEVKHEKIMHMTLDLIKNFVAQKWFDGSGDDYVSSIDFDTGTKKFKSLQNISPNNERNLANSLLDCVLMPIKDNYND